MKKKILLYGITIIFLYACFPGFANEKPAKDPYKMPDQVKAIVEKSCFGCHNTASKNEDAKEELDFKKFDNLSTIQKISAYKNIAETVEEESMPPKKFLNRYPERKLTDEEKKVLIDWAKKEAMELVKTK